MPKIGGHVSAAKSLALSFERAQNIEAECTQIFVSPPQQWVQSKHDEAEIEEYESRFADINETAAFLKVPKSWLYQRTRKNAVPVVRVGKYVRFDLREIARWARAGCPG